MGDMKREVASLKAEAKIWKRYSEELEQALERLVKAFTTSQMICEAEAKKFHHNAAHRNLWANRASAHHSAVVRLRMEYRYVRCSDEADKIIKTWVQEATDDYNQVVSESGNKGEE